jgi:hypothetical protein
MTDHDALFGIFYTYARIRKKPENCVTVMSQVILVSHNPLKGNREDE